MENDKDKNAYNQLLKGISSYVKKIVGESSVDVTYNATIKSVNANNTYTIDLNRHLYNNIPTIGGYCKVGEVVKVLVPQRQFSSMIILKATHEDKEIIIPEVEELPFKLGIDANGNYGYYKRGADTLTPFRSGKVTFDEGSGLTLVEDKCVLNFFDEDKNWIQSSVVSSGQYVNEPYYITPAWNDKNGTAVIFPMLVNGVGTVKNIYATTGLITGLYKFFGVNRTAYPYFICYEYTQSRYSGTLHLVTHFFTSDVGETNGDTSTTSYSFTYGRELNVGISSNYIEMYNRQLSVKGNNNGSMTMGTFDYAVFNAYENNRRYLTNMTSVLGKEKAWVIDDKGLVEGSWS